MAWTQLLGHMKLDLPTDVLQQETGELLSAHQVVTWFHTIQKSSNCLSDLELDGLASSAIEQTLMLVNELMNSDKKRDVLSSACWQHVRKTVNLSLDSELLGSLRSFSDPNAGYFGIWTDGYFGIWTDLHDAFDIGELSRICEADGGLCGSRADGIRRRCNSVTIVCVLCSLM